MDRIPILYYNNLTIHENDLDVNDCYYNLIGVKRRLDSIYLLYVQNDNFYVMSASRNVTMLMVYYMHHLLSNKCL